MRRVIALFVLFALLAPAFGAYAQGGQSAPNHPPVLVSFEASQTIVDIVGGAGGELVFTAEAHPGRSSSDGPSDAQTLADHVASMQVRMVPVTGQLGKEFVLPIASRTAIGQASDFVETWTVSLPIDDARLTAGQWRAEATVTDRFGATHTTGQTGAAEPLNLTVGATSLPAFTLGIVGLQPGAGGVFPTQEISKGSILQVVPDLSGQPHLLHRLEYRFGTQGTTEQFPSGFWLHWDRFPQGETNLFITATDRLGRERPITLPVVVDTIPPALMVQVPAVTYQGVSFNVEAVVSDASDHTVSILVGGDEIGGVTGAAGENQVYTLPATRTELGNSTILVRAVDAFGNEAVVGRTIVTVEHTPDTFVRAVHLVDTRALAGDTVRLDSLLSQRQGVGPVPVTATLNLEGSDHVQVANAVIPGPNGTVVIPFQAQLPVGRHILNVTVHPDQPAIESNPVDQSRLFEFDVYLGRVLHGDDSYYIRADERGLPASAVGDDDRTYPLTLRAEGRENLYEFTVGDQVLYWNIAEQTTVVPVQEDGSDRAIPGTGALLVVGALLGLVALHSRSRWRS